MAVIWVRSAIYAAWFWGGGLLIALCGQILPRSALPAYAGFWSRMMLGGLWIVGIRVEVEGLERLPKSGPMLIASQHQSEFDTMIWLKLLPRCRYVVKAELLRIPLFGRLMRRNEQIAVDRAGGAATMRLLLRQGAIQLAKGSQVVIFPEGTRVKFGETAPLQPGVAALAARSRLPVFPVATNSGRCWPGKEFLKRPGVIRVVILPPQDPEIGRDAVLEGLAQAYAQATRSL
jgi:1-acyl-sn-glycerol-3-phosphate acyltransferase